VLSGSLILKADFQRNVVVILQTNHSKLREERWKDELIPIPGPQPEEAFRASVPI
jgi:hypothetical protein